MGLENELHREKSFRDESYRRRPEGSTELEGMYSADDTPPPRKPKSPVAAQVSPEVKVKAGKSSKVTTVEALRPLPSKPPPPKSRRPPTKAGRQVTESSGLFYKWFKNTQSKFLENLCCSCVQNMDLSGLNFAHVMTAELSWPVQTFGLTGSLVSKLVKKRIFYKILIMMSYSAFEIGSRAQV